MQAIEEALNLDLWALSYASMACRRASMVIFFSACEYMSYFCEILPLKALLYGRRLLGLSIFIFCFKLMIF